ncbi:MAG: tRNA pseudouridine(55) synthase TruB [Erysipelotrichaceae bacterium]
MQNLLILVNKPPGITSFDVVYQIRKILNPKKIGHTGTLDPNAEGLMLIVLNEATKLNPFIVHQTKQYEASMKLGLKTDTADIWGEVIESQDVLPFDKKQLISVLESFIGVQTQVTPKVSAVKVKGKRLYEYAYKNQDVILPTRSIEILKIELLDYTNDTIHFIVDCSKGTYIRTLCEDIALKLGTVGCMSYLKRLKVGNISVDSAYTLQEIENGSFSYEPIFTALNLPILEINDIKEVKDIKDGKPLALVTSEETVLLTHQASILAIYKLDDTIHKYRCLRGLWE